MGYGKDCFLGQPYELLKPEILCIKVIYRNQNEDSFI
jgi:hypothetical protein